MLSKTIIKDIQSLSQRKKRDVQGLFIAEGPKVVHEFLASGNVLCKSIFALKNWLAENEALLKNISKENKSEISDIELSKISLQQTPNSVVGIFYKRKDKQADLKNSITLMLDEIQDPGNMGTIIRTADWFGVKNIICSNECVDCYNPKVVQASMGSLGRINIIYGDLENFINSSSGIKTYAATLHGKNISSIKKIKEGIILIGNESKGIKENLLQLVTEQITIPKLGETESLNAAVAAGIILSYAVELN